jgi:hypothetical protein
MGCAMLLAGVAVASARGERELTNDELRAEMSRNRALAAYVARNGDPDVAESHFLADAPPWDDHEVTLYYFEARKEIGFARAWILGRPDVHLERYERPLTDEHIAALSSRLHGKPMTHVEEPSPMAPPVQTEAAAPTMDPDARAEAAALRAEEAAARVEQAADTAEHAADRADAVTTEMQGAFQRALLK